MANQRLFLNGTELHGVQSVRVLESGGDMFATITTKLKSFDFSDAEPVPVKRRRRRRGRPVKVSQ